jgi:hypothetical protein
MRTGLDGNTRATREYQHTNRRVTKITPHPRFTSWPLSVPLTSKKKSKINRFCPLTFYQPYQRQS